MKNIFYLLLFFSISASASDTINVWHVFFNKNKIKEFNQFNRDKKIVLKLKELKATDSIKVEYFTDYHCQDCKISFSVDSNKTIIDRDINNENSFSFSLSKLVDWMKKEGLSKFKVYRHDWNYRPPLKQLLFEIQLE